MTLYEGEKGKSYSVRELLMEDGLTRRLQALGVNEGTVVNILNRKKRGALIVSVRGTRLAVGRHISENIKVDECEKQPDACPEERQGNGK